MVLEGDSKYLSKIMILFVFSFVRFLVYSQIYSLMALLGRWVRMIRLPRKP